MSFVVGLTGGIGSGKSAAAAEFGRLGAAVVDTDAIAHELTVAGGGAIPEVRRVFGAAAIDASGAMDRGKMRARVFADPGAKKALEALLHPLIREESQRRIAATRSPYVIYVVPLLVESADYRQRVDRVLVIDAPEELQVERVRSRSGLSEAEVRAIVAAQATRAQRLAAADDVIENRGTIDALREQVAALHRKYLEYGQAAQ
ncbi:MAG TPA: dephospho-CoA kinase [Burkholderiales bacterium]|jgi:dephospho-CoA kinase